MLVGTAEVLVLANTKGFDKQLREETAPGLTGLRRDAETAGSDAGMALRGGVTRETGKLAKDLEADGERAGEGLHKGVSGGLSKVSALLESTGLPLGALSHGFEKAGDAAEHAGTKSSGLVGSLEKVGGVATAGLLGAGAAVAGIGVHLAEGMQKADAAIAGATGTSIASAKTIGDAFLGTAGKSEFSGQEIAAAYAQVAGQLKTTEGHALSTADAMKVMTAADDLATAKQIDLGTATSSVAGVMQAFQLKASDAAHVSDILYQASTATGQGVDTLSAALERVHSRLGDAGGSVGDLSGLLVDMTERGITGRSAMMALNTSMNTLQRTATGVQTQLQLQRTAYDQMSPALKDLADQYQSGAISSADLTKATKNLPAAQQQLVSEFTTATKAVETAQIKYKQLGVTAFDAKGKFVGLGSIIDQLHPKFAQMTQQQQLAAATTLFGAGAARQMLAVIQAGPAAYDKATQSVGQMGAAHDAAAKQATTLHVEEKTLEAEMGDLATRVGEVLIPVITSMVGWFVKATSFVADHKAALIALAAVVTGILGPAIAVFAINKMASFVHSFQDASGHVKSFASDVQTAVQKVMGLFTQQTNAANTMAQKVGGSFDTVGSKAAGSATNVETATANVEGDAAAMATDVEASNTATGASFTAVGTDAGAAATEVGVAEGTITTEVAAADTAIEADNAAAGASWIAALGPLAVAGGAVGLAQLLNAQGPEASAPKVGAPGSGIKTASGQSYYNPRVAPFTSPTGAAGSTLSQTAKGLGITLPNASAGGTPGDSTIGHREGSRHAHMATGFHTSFLSGLTAKAHTATDAMAKAASGPLTKSQLEQLWVQAGGNPADANVAASIALAESGGNVGAAGDVGLGGSGPTSFGLWQVHTPAHPQYNAAELASNPLYNARAAVAISDNGASFTPWSTYNSGAYRQYLGVPGSVGGTGMLDGSPTGPASIPAASAIAGLQQSAPVTAAQRKAALATEIAKEKASVAAEILKLHAELAGTVQTVYTTSKSGKVTAHTHHVPVAPDVKAKVDAQIAALKGALGVEVAQQKGALATQTAQQKAELKTQSSDLKAGTGALNKMLTAIHSGGVKQLQSALWQVHLAGMSSIEHRLDHDHSAALAELSKQLVAVHKQAMSDLAKATAQAAEQAAEKAQTTLLNKSATDLTRTATDQARTIAEDTKVFLDQQAEVGKTGADLIAAQAQTSLDQITQANDNAISAAQAQVDAAAGGSALAQAQAGYGLAQAQAAASIQEAQAQSVLDKANAAAQAANAPGAAASTTSTTTNAPTIVLQLNGAANATPGAWMSEIAWALKTGALPLATAAA